jgi:hypothetical protein
LKPFLSVLSALLFSAPAAALPPGPADTRGPAAQSVGRGWIELAPLMKLAQRKLPSTGSGDSPRSRRGRLNKSGAFTRPYKGSGTFTSPATPQGLHTTPYNERKRKKTIDLRGPRDRTPSRPLGSPAPTPGSRSSRTPLPPRPGDRPSSPADRADGPPDPDERFRSPPPRYHWRKKKTTWQYCVTRYYGKQAVTSCN